MVQNDLDSRVASAESVEEVAELLRVYDVVRSPRPARPWVMCNLVATIDGRTAVFGRVGPLSNTADQALFHHIRGLSDAIVVGAATVRAEQYGPPRISEEVAKARRARGQLPEPRMCIVSRSLDLGDAVDVLDSNGARPIVLTCDDAPPTRAFDVARKAELISAGTDRVDLSRGLAALRRHGVRVVVCEGGPTLNAELLELGMVDEVCVTFAPMLGGDPLTMFGSHSATLQRLRIVATNTVDNSVFVRALVEPSPR